MVRQAFSAAGDLSGAVQMGKRQVQCLCVAGAFASCKDVFCEGSLPEPFVVTIQGQESLNLQKFVYGHHDALILDNLVDWSLVLKHRALLQSNLDMHTLGESATGVYAYKVYLWAVPVCMTLDIDVDMEPYHSSEWLRANVLLDVLPTGAKCFEDGERPRIRMADMPQLKH